MGKTQKKDRTNTLAVACIIACFSFAYDFSHQNAVFQWKLPLAILLVTGVWGVRTPLESSNESRAKAPDPRGRAVTAHGAAHSEPPPPGQARRNRGQCLAHERLPHGLARRARRDRDAQLEAFSRACAEERDAKLAHAAVAALIAFAAPQPRAARARRPVSDRELMRRHEALIQRTYLARRLETELSDELLEQVLELKDASIRRSSCAIRD